MMFSEPKPWSKGKLALMILLAIIANVIGWYVHIRVLRWALFS